MSLRTKILVVLIVLSAFTSVTFLLFARRTFESDKRAFVFESTLSLSRNLVSNIETKIDMSISVLRSLVQGFDLGSRSFHEISDNLFQESQYLQVQVWNKVDPAWQMVSELTKLGQSKVSDQFAKKFESYVPGQIYLGLEELIGKEAKSKLLTVAFALNVGAENPRRYVIVALLPLTIFDSIFANLGAGQAFAFLTSGQSVIADSRADAAARPPGADERADMIKKFLDQGSKVESISEIDVARESQLVGFVPSNKYQVAVISAVPAGSAMSAVYVLQKQVALLFAIAVLASVLVGLFASKNLTQTLSSLIQATQRISEGQFKLDLRITGSDEISHLAHSFQSMSGEIERLMVETAEKARMQGELQTAKTVQDMLFPAPSKDLGAVKVAGRYLSASECGGDWWYYWDAGDRSLIWIADATGHGVPAALITSASCAAVAVLRHYQERSLTAIAKAMNYAIAQTSHGTRMMTMFLVQIDKKTGVMEYVNSSHLPAILVDKSLNSESRWTDVPMLVDPISPMLGESEEAEFLVGQHQLRPGERVLLITDGMHDLVDKSGKTLGERRFVSKLIKEVLGNSELSVDQLADGALKVGLKYADGIPPVDDITVVSFEYSPELVF